MSKKRKLLHISYCYNCEKYVPYIFGKHHNKYPGRKIECMYGEIHNLKCEGKDCIDNRAMVSFSYMRFLIEGKILCTLCRDTKYNLIRNEVGVK